MFVSRRRQRVQCKYTPPTRIRVVIHSPGIPRFHGRLIRLHDDMSLCNNNGRCEKAGRIEASHEPIPFEGFQATQSSATAWP